MDTTTLLTILLTGVSVLAIEHFVLIWLLMVSRRSESEPWQDVMQYLQRIEASGKRTVTPTPTPKPIPTSTSKPTSQPLPAIQQTTVTPPPQLLTTAATNTTPTPATTCIILRTIDKSYIGRRPDNHPDVDTALKTPGLEVVYEDGTIDQGVQ